MWEYKWDEQEVKGIKDLPGEGLKIGTVRLPLVSNPAEKVLYPLLWEYEREEITCWKRRLSFFEKAAKYVRNADESELAEVQEKLAELQVKATAMEKKIKNDARQSFTCDGKCNTAIKLKNELDTLKLQFAEEKKTYEAQTREAKRTAPKDGTQKKIDAAVQSANAKLEKKHKAELHKCHNENQRLQTTLETTQQVQGIKQQEHAVMQAKLEVLEQWQKSTQQQAAATPSSTQPSPHNQMVDQQQAASVSLLLQQQNLRNSLGLGGNSLGRLLGHNPFM